MNEHILVLEPVDFNSEALAIFESIGTTINSSTNPLERSDKDAITILVCRMHYFLNKAFLGYFPNVHTIVNATIDDNHIDYTYCNTRGIRVINIKNEKELLQNIRSTSELAFSLISTLVRNVVPSIKSVVEQHHWDNIHFKGRRLGNLTLGLLGFGRVARQMVMYANVFDMKVIAHDPYVEKENFDLLEVENCSKEELFSNANIISVHASFSPENENLVTRKEFERMKPGSYFVNTARGELVCEDDLIWALENGHLAGAALDVLAHEEELDKLFTKKVLDYATNHDNLIITPHLGSCTLDAMRQIELFVAEKLKEIVG